MMDAVETPEETMVDFWEGWHQFVTDTGTVLEETMADS